MVLGRFSIPKRTPQKPENRAGVRYLLRFIGSWGFGRRPAEVLQKDYFFEGGPDFSGVQKSDCLVFYDFGSLLWGMDFRPFFRNHIFPQKGCCNRLFLEPCDAEVDVRRKKNARGQAGDPAGAGTPSHILLEISFSLTLA